MFPHFERAGFEASVIEKLRRFSSFESSERCINLWVGFNSSLVVFEKPRGGVAVPADKEKLGFIEWGGESR